METQLPVSGVEHDLAGVRTTVWIKRLGPVMCSAVIMALMLSVPQLVQAASHRASPTAQWVVNTTVDESDGSCSDGDCSLRDAMAVSANGDTITFGGDYTIYLNSQLALTKTLTIDGSNHTVTISGDSGNDGSANVRVFSLAAGKVVTMTHLSIVKGNADMGGGIYNAGTLTLQDSLLADNMASCGNSGGAIWNESGTLTLIRTTVATNTAGSNGGELHCQRGGFTRWTGC